MTETTIHLNASADVYVPNDEAVLWYRIEASGRNAQLLSEQVNRISNKLDMKLRGKGLDRQTMGRRLEPDWQTKQGIRHRIGWRLVQSERLSTRNFENLSGLVTEIENVGARLDNLAFRPSNDSVRQAQKNLLRQAVWRFREKAATLTKALGADDYRIIELQTHEGPPVEPMRSLSLAKSTESAPTLNQGKSNIRVTVSGRIQLPLTRFPVAGK